MVGGLIFISCSHSTLGSRVQILNYKMAHIHPIHKGVSLFLLYTNMNKINIPNLATSCNLRVIAVKCFKIRAISDLRDL